MDTRSSKFVVYVALAFVAGFPSLAFSVPVQKIYGGDFDLPIPALDDPQREFGRGRMADAIIDVPEHFIIQDVDVVVALTHGGLFDLQITLQSPAGTNVVLNPAGNLAFIVRGEDGRLTAVGGSGQWFFDDEAEISIENATEPFFGPFRPVEPYKLSVFDGEDTYGLWRLKINDAFFAHTGTLDSFELIVTIPEPATAILLTLGAGLMGLFRSRRRQ